MLSILIPTYNYNVYPLIKKLHEQAHGLQFPIEIVVIDDCSTHNIEDNKKINDFSKATFEVLPKNIGRSAIRNLLARKASYDWMLFLDADVMPTNNDFLSNYQESISQTNGIIYGGIEYQKERPSTDRILRWKYGRKREALDLKNRKLNKYLRFLTLNFLAHKTVFEKVSFNEEIPNKRHEDTLFALELERNNVPLLHVDNTVIHHGIEKNEEFLEKSLESVEALSLFMKKGLLKAENTKLSKVYSLITKLGLRSFFNRIYNKYSPKFEDHLLSKNPNLIIFDLYRLCFLCNLEST